MKEIKSIKKALSLTLIISFVTISGYIFLEPQLTSGKWVTIFGYQASAATSSTGISLTVTGEINITCSSTAALSPNMAGISGGTATGTFTCTVTTNDSSGYNLKLKKDQLLLTGAGGADSQFSDYATATASTDWTWDTTAAGEEEFGFCVNTAASTTDIRAKHLDDGAANCATGASVTEWHCWHHIPTDPSDEEVANRTSPTPSVGVAIDFGLRATAGASNHLTEGTYTSTSTATAVVNS